MCRQQRAPGRILQRAACVDIPLDASDVVEPGLVQTEERATGAGE
jgi:hypothetical protein